MKYLKSISAFFVALGSMFNWVNNNEKREVLACMRSAKMMSFWILEFDKPLEKRNGAVNNDYCLKKLKHYADQFNERENRLTS